VKLKNLRSQNMESLIVGLVGVFVGVFLTIVWDLYKTNIADKRNEEVIFSEVVDDLESNFEIISNNQRLLNEEIKILPKQQSVVIPLLSLKNGYFELLKINFSVFSKHPEEFVEARNMAVAIDLINETIQSRENYRISNGAMSNYDNRLKIYDDMLVQLNNQLLVSMKNFKEKMNKRT
jgi:hypothetical protein